MIGTMVGRIFSSIGVSVVAKDSEVDQVAAAERAMAVTQARIAELTKDFDPRQDCCPSCRWGSTYGDLERKIERQAMWLRVQYRKRGDTKAVERLEFEHGKQQLDALEASGGRAQ